MKSADARILFTGAAGGIGQAACQLLIRSGASLLMVGRSPAKLSALARSLPPAEGRVENRTRWHACDLTSAQAIDGLVAAARDWRCNVVVHGAGLPAFGRLESIAPEESRESMPSASSGVVMECLTNESRFVSLNKLTKCFLRVGERGPTDLFAISSRNKSISSAFFPRTFGIYAT